MLRKDAGICLRKNCALRPGLVQFKMAVSLQHADTIADSMRDHVDSLRDDLLQHVDSIRDDIQDDLENSGWG